MKKTVLIYGVILAALLFILEYFDYRYHVRELDIEFYILLIAVLFTGTGIWVGRILTKPQADNEPFQRNSKAIDYLGISERELEVLELVAKGLSNQQIAGKLFVSVNTIKTHLSHLYEKLEVKRRTQAVEKAKSLNLIK